jgi:tRNA1Val (adenine37-N6)-methyltransferase
MPNDWFQFKQFRIWQDQCAMKVSTDACIQGAWAAAQWSHTHMLQPRILDIGTGTGLLSLMLAQALSGALFDAVEINEGAYLQAVSNFKASIWKQQLHTFHASLAAFRQTVSLLAKYDCIVCNPPFFNNHLESQDKARNDARHGQSLSKQELAEAVIQLLAIEGQFCIMFPASEWDAWLKTSAQAGLFLVRYLTVQPKPASSPNRIIGIFSKQKPKEILSESLTIYIAEKQYSPEMMALLKDYYLAF